MGSVPIHRDDNLVQQNVAQCELALSANLLVWMKYSYSLRIFSVYYVDSHAKSSDTDSPEPAGLYEVSEDDKTAQVVTGVRLGVSCLNMF